ncbi:hypothetical protein HCN51_08110 [Nonomuraea sp. FMUSA5-5]|uniref:Uncharacterized protein n=1 Tax=Nonomuraea composti TaxID=2720023 RepID=A0ABX1AUU2_9ACTN|nr:hypothetical protein [Nonomuraea sp. FMUSA5-5]NJP89408.1 hypothetical protein [Nonomuraea sp. FMUSA5-5]
MEEQISSGDEEIDREFRERLQRRYADLSRVRKVKLEELKTLGASAEPTEDKELLDELPRLAANLATVGEDLQRKLFDAFNLELRYRVDTHEVLIRITVKEDNLRAIKALTSKIADPPGGDRRPMMFPLF